jgi:NADH:ubiquinone oxidoreductase subunit 3 (subunit A)
MSAQSKKKAEITFDASTAFQYLWSNQKILVEVLAVLEVIMLIGVPHFLLYNVDRWGMTY